jgi:hypothetical protein
MNRACARAHKWRMCVSVVSLFQLMVRLLNRHTESTETLSATLAKAAFQRRRRGAADDEHMTLAGAADISSKNYKIEGGYSERSDSEAADARVTAAEAERAGGGGRELGPKECGADRDWRFPCPETNEARLERQRGRQRIARSGLRAWR